MHSLAIDLRLLGPVQLHIDGQEVKVGGPMPRAVLALLALQPNHPVSAARLQLELWPDGSQAQVQRRLHLLIHKLRARLQQNPEHREVLRTVAPGYQLDLGETESDLSRFEAARKAGDEADARGDHATAAALYRAALAEWGDSADPLADLRDFDFAERTAHVLREHWWSCFTARVDAELAVGSVHQLIPELTALSDREATRESLWLQLATALQLSGRPGDAIDVLRRARKMITDSLGLEPSPLIADLEQRILTQRLPIGPSPAGGFRIAPTVERFPSAPAASVRLPNGQAVRIGAAGVRIGRMRDNDIVLDDPGVSRYHVEIKRTRAGLVVRDTGSTNGVEVNGQLIVQQAELTDGDRIAVGEVLLIVESGRS